MAAYQISKTDEDYLCVIINFQGHTFPQQIITEKTGEELNILLQDYADKYEQEWLKLKVDE